MENNLRIFTTVWGSNHLDWFERACARSLSWDGNKKAISGAKWTLFTKKQDLERAAAIIRKTGVTHVEFAEIPANVEGNTPAMGAVLLECLLQMIEVSITDGSKVLMAPPDTIFGEGTIEALKIAGKAYGSCVAVPHPRVSPSIFGGIKDSLTNAQLVSLALKHGHKAWTEAEDGHPRQNSFVGGISWRRLGPKVIGVTHRLPTVYLASFLPSDLSFFKRPRDGYQPTFGAFDHAWPTDLIKQERQRTIGSSDAACILEVTKEDLNVPPVQRANPFEPDAFWRELYHNQINRQYIYVMREE